MRTRQRGLAEQLYDSLFGTLLKLADDVEVYPGHGAGSLCGAGIGKAPHSTIGQERRLNPLLQQRTKADFVAAVLGDLPETPPYFPRMKEINRNGPAVRGLAAGVPPPFPLEVHDAADLVEDGALVIDMRSPEAFAAAHPAGAVNIGFRPTRRLLGRLDRSCRQSRRTAGDRSWSGRGGASPAPACRF